MDKQQEIDRILAKAEREERQVNSRERFRIADLQELRNEMDRSRCGSCGLTGQHQYWCARGKRS